MNGFQTLLEQEYGARRGQEGQRHLPDLDGLMKVQVQIADQIAFGPELHSAKKLIDECLLEWGAQSHEAIRALVNRVFSVEKEGQINRAELFSSCASMSRTCALAARHGCHPRCHPRRRNQELRALLRAQRPGRRMARDHHRPCCSLSGGEDGIQTHYVL